MFHIRLDSCQADPNISRFDLKAPAFFKWIEKQYSVVTNMKPVKIIITSEFLYISGYRKGIYRF